MPTKKAEHTEAVASRFLAEIDHLKRLHSDVVDKIGIAASYVSQIRNGSRSPTVDHLVNMCKWYGYSGTWLLTGAGMKMSEPENKPLEERLTAIEKQLSAINANLVFDKDQGNKKGNKIRK